MEREKPMPVSTLAKRLGCSRSSVYQLINLCELADIRTGKRNGIRLSETSFQSYLESCRINPDSA